MPSPLRQGARPFWEAGVRRHTPRRARSLPAIPAEWKGLIGEYGWDHDTLYIFEKDGHLTALIEWIEYDPLSEVSKDVFKFPTDGLYDGEQAIFTRDSHGEATQVRVSGVRFKRRPIGDVADGG